MVELDRQRPPAGPSSEPIDLTETAGLDASSRPAGTSRPTSSRARHRACRVADARLGQPLALPSVMRRPTSSGSPPGRAAVGHGPVPRASTRTRRRSRPASRATLAGVERVRPPAPRGGRCRTRRRSSPTSPSSRRSGRPGMAALERLRAAIPADVPVVADAKRGDIGSTAARQAVALFDGLGADAVTVNPYLGAEAHRAAPRARRPLRLRPVPDVESRAPASSRACAVGAPTTTARRPSRLWAGSPAGSPRWGPGRDGRPRRRGDGARPSSRRIRGDRPGPRVPRPRRRRPGRRGRAGPRARPATRGAGRRPAGRRAARQRLARHRPARRSTAGAGRSGGPRRAARRGGRREWVATAPCAIVGRPIRRRRRSVAHRQSTDFAVQRGHPQHAVQHRTGRAHHRPGHRA